MATISIRELKKQISELIRLAPVNKPKSKTSSRAWMQLDSLAAQIGANWKKGLSAAKAISQGRR